MTESTHRTKVDQLRREIGRLEQSRADAAKKEARHRDSAARNRRGITKSTATSIADSKRRLADSEDRYADGERDKGVKLLASIAKKQRDLAQAEKALAEAVLRRIKQEADTARRAKDAQEREVLDLRRQMTDLSDELTAVSTALARELPELTTVLLMYADPTATLELDEEMRSIHQAIRLSEHRDHVRLEPRWAARPADFSQALLDVQPSIVHISGHGAPDGSLLFKADDGGERLVSAADVVGLIKAIGENVRVVVFNACFSEVIAAVAAQHVEIAIGMDAPVTDEGARAFAEGFYRAIGSGVSVGQAFEVARFEMRNTPGFRADEAEAVMVARVGTDPASIFLVAVPEPS